MNGPRFFSSGRRFGPYFSSRLDASVAPRPFCLSTASLFTTSSMGIAYQATLSVAASAFVGSVMMIGLPMRRSCSVVKDKGMDAIQYVLKTVTKYVGRG